MLGLIVVAVASSAATVVVMRGRRDAGRDMAPAALSARLTERLEVQLARARTIPGTELLLECLAARAVIDEQELSEFKRQLDNLERKANVEAARKDVARERRAAMVARAARQGLLRLTPAKRDTAR